MKNNSELRSRALQTILYFFVIIVCLVVLTKYIVDLPINWKATAIALTLLISTSILNKTYPRSTLIPYAALSVFFVFIFSFWMLTPFEEYFFIYILILPVIGSKILGFKKSLTFNVLITSSVLLVILYFPLNQKELYNGYLSSKIIICLALMSLISFSYEWWRTKDESEINFLAFTDPLTQLPNRTKLIDELNNWCHSFRVSKSVFSITLIDLDKFSQINTLLGQAFGDKVIIDISKVLPKILQNQAFIARFYGDEYCILSYRFTDKDIQSLFDDLHVELNKISKSCLKSLHLTASMGVSRFPEDGHNADTLLQAASLAKTEAKEKGGQSFKIYNEAYSIKNQRLIQLEELLENSLERGEMTVHYQPKVNLKDRSIDSLEALVRWTNPELGFVSPGEFIPLAEQSDFVVTLGEWVLEQSMIFLRKIKKETGKDLTICVNVAPPQFYKEGFVESLEKLIKTYDIQKGQLELELTERILLKKDFKIIELFQKIKSLGIRLALDDFGTGYSSMSYMKDIAFDSLKIDKSYIDDVVKKEEHQMLLMSFIDIAKRFKMDIVAEGVEELEQVKLLENSGVTEIQGWYFSKALPADKALLYINNFKYLS